MYGSSVCQVLCQLQNGHIVSVFSTLQKEASWIAKIVTFFPILQIIPPFAFF